ncbi:hypothetical protein B0H14DRAFT_2569183 [Mycena olivaceomarginata]|nr:hypothetical protein B0H14DRAFT_2569183 [Mycena olivaceomarginata]
MHQALTDLAQVYFVEGHSVHNRINFGGSRAEFQTNYGDLWGMFADAVIPRPLVTEDSVIPRNAFGVPVFPGIDLNIVTPADTLQSAHVWAPVTDYPPIPWEDLACNPSAYYDTVKFSLPLKLALPQTLNTLHTKIWAEHLIRTSSAFADTPFVFCSKERLMEVNGPLATPVQANGDSVAAATMVSPFAPQPGNQSKLFDGRQVRRLDCSLLLIPCAEAEKGDENERYDEIISVFLNIVNNAPNLPSMDTEKEETVARAKQSGEKRPIQAEDCENSNHKRAKKSNKNSRRKSNEGTSSKTEVSSFNCATVIVTEGSSRSVGSSNSQEGPWGASSLVRTSGFGLADNVLSHMRRGYVCSDEEADAFDDDA